MCQLLPKRERKRGGNTVLWQCWISLLFLIVGLTLPSLSPVTQAQDDSNRRNNDRESAVEGLLTTALNPTTNALIWQSRNLESGSTVTLGTFGLSTDYPIVGIWEPGDKLEPAVLRKLNASSYELLKFSHDRSVKIGELAPAKLSIFSGDVDGDDLSDLIFAAPRKGSIRWNTFVKPFQNNERKGKHAGFDFGRASDTPFIFKWREKYHSFAVITPPKGKNRAIKITHCFASCKRQRIIRIQREALSGFDQARPFAFGVKNQRELFLFEDEIHSLSGNRILTIARAKKTATLK
jgi:hypothetical protein